MKKEQLEIAKKLEMHKEIIDFILDEFNNLLESPSNKILKHQRLTIFNKNNYNVIDLFTHKYESEQDQPKLLYISNLLQPETIKFIESSIKKLNKELIKIDKEFSNL